MRIIPVLDVRHGQAVHAVAGDRAHYGPLRSVLHPGTDPVQLATAARKTWGSTDLYLADLDAIIGERSPNLSLYERLARTIPTLWVDPGIRHMESISACLGAGVGQVIVGLETLPGPETLDAIIRRFGPEPIVFSLDLRDARPIFDPGSHWDSQDPRQIAKLAAQVGVRRIVHLDLARVGTGRNPTLETRSPTLHWLAQLGFEFPGLDWLVGGGVSGPQDLETLRDHGAWGALVGSSLHDGRVIPNLDGGWS